jgi:nuclear cap-binding protein subunit 1
MFRLIEDSLLSVASGSNDIMIERSDDPTLLNEDDLVREWGKRWLRVFRRKAAVEEAFITEAMANAVPLGTTAPPPPPAPEPTPAAVPADAAEDQPGEAAGGAGEDDDMADIY